MLKAVSGNESPSQSSLVEQIGIDRSTLAEIVRRLVQRGLL
ncbi:MAG: MarR family transcriptional regulator [Filomicrobium sp.]